MEKYLLPFNHAKDMKKHAAGIAANYENMNFRVALVIKLKIHSKIRKYKLKLMAVIHFMIIYSL